MTNQSICLHRIAIHRVMYTYVCTYMKRFKTECTWRKVRRPRSHRGVRCTGRVLRLYRASELSRLGLRSTEKREIKKQIINVHCVRAKNLVLVRFYLKYIMCCWCCMILLTKTVLSMPKKFLALFCIALNIINLIKKNVKL